MRVFAHRLPGSLRRGLGALSVLFFSVLPCPVHAQQVSLSFAQGTHLFRRMLYDLHLQPLPNRRTLNDSFQQLEDEPGKKLLIVLGETEFSQTRLIENFVRQGGAVLLATDRKCNDIWRPFGVAVVGDPVEVSARKFAYKESKDCIFVQPRGQGYFLFKNLSVEDGLSRVATNRPGYLVCAQDCKLKPLATFPPGCRAMLERTGRRGPVGRQFLAEDTPFAVGGDWEHGRILILSDHSVFINAMMWQSDIDNFDFAYNCVNWLIDGDKRTHVLFLEEGRIQDTFQIPLKEPPLPPIPPLKAMVETADKSLVELERDNVFNRAINKGVMELTEPPDKRVQGIILMSTLLLVVFGLARLTQARHRHEKTTVSAGFGSGRTPAATSLLDQRHQSMLYAGNLWEPARALARQGFESALGPQFLGNRGLPGSSPGAPLLPPRLKGGWWRNWRLRRRLKRLWQLAYGAEPVRISPRQLRHLGRDIESMKAMLDRTPPAA